MKYIKTYEWFNPFKKAVSQEDMEYILEKMIYHMDDNELAFDFSNTDPKIKGNIIDCSNNLGFGPEEGTPTGFKIIVKSLSDYKIEAAYLTNFRIIDLKFKKIEECIDYITRFGFGIHPIGYAPDAWLAIAKRNKKWD